MPRYALHATITVSVYTEVEAPTVEAAREKAMERHVQRLNHTCSGDPTECWALGGELDGALLEEAIDEVTPV
jgi:hypothetical protein